MKSLYILLALLLFISCGEEAGKFDISKELDFPLIIQTPQNITQGLDTAILIDIENNGGLRDYKDFSEGYTFNTLSYEITEVTNGSSATLNLVTFFQGATGEQVLFELSQESLEATPKTILDISSEALEQLSGTVTDHGGFELRFTTEPGMEPASFTLTLYFDTTVAVNFEL